MERARRPAARHVRRREPHLYRPARRPEDEQARPDEDVHQPDVQRSDGHAREEDLADEPRPEPLDPGVAGHRQQYQAEERDGEEEPYYVPPRHHRAGHRGYAFVVHAVGDLDLLPPSVVLR